ncbi:MAG: GxxExxY protein [Chitinophagaceae bacterium]|nr:MAG: GxxExxY protein [Chitinophagaceae bacterium]
MTADQLNAIGAIILDSAITVHRILGPGLLESAYQRAMTIELRLRGLKVACEVPVHFLYKGHDLGKTYEVDILVEDEIIIECKSVAAIIPNHKAQLITHLKLKDLHLGYLINFNVPRVKDGFHRVVHHFA